MLFQCMESCQDNWQFSFGLFRCSDQEENQAKGKGISLAT